MNKEKLSNQILFADGGLPNENVKQLIAQRLEEWVRIRQYLLFLPNSFSYRVRFSRETREREIICSVDVAIGSRQWRGKGFGIERFKALEHAVANLEYSRSPGSTAEAVA